MGIDVGSVERGEGVVLSENAKAYVSHHVRNELFKITLSLERGQTENIRLAVNHIVDDLERIGC